METKEFRKLIRQHFKPKINEIGFIGSDHHFIKEADNYIYTLVIQANKYGGSCIMEMGVHPIFLLENPNSKFTVYDCEFRKRIEIENTFFNKILGSKTSEKWHEYGDNENDSIKTINEMYNLFKNQGLNYYNQFSINTITSISIDEITTGSQRLNKLGAPHNIRLVLLIAKKHKYLGNTIETNTFAKWGLENLGNATGLIDDFEALIGEV